MRLICGGVTLPFPFLPLPFRATNVKSPSSSVGCGARGGSLVPLPPVPQCGLVTSLGMAIAGVGLFRASSCTIGGGIERSSSASKRASILFSTSVVALAAAASGCWRFIGGLGGGI